MTAGPWFPVNTLREKLLRGQFDFDSDIFKAVLYLSTTNLSPTSTTAASVTNEHANANGYTSGGIGVTFTISGSRLVTVSFATMPTWAASGGPIVARWAAIIEAGGDVAFISMLDRTSTAPSNAVWGTPTGDNVTITSSGGLLPSVSAGTIFEIGDHSNTANNGLYVATGSPTTSSLPATKLTSAAPAAAAAEAVTVYLGANATAADGSILALDSDGTPNPVFDMGYA